MKKLVIGALAALTVAAVGGAVAPTASATDPVEVSLAVCDFVNGGTTTVPAGVPISLRNPGWGTGSYGQTKDYLLKQTTTDIIVRNGITTVVDLTNLYSDPQQLDRNFWLTRPSNTELSALAAGESVLVTNHVVFSSPVVVAYPPVGPSGDRGPYVLFGGTDDVSCLITAV
jgi:hypothetical protein